MSWLVHRWLLLYGIALFVIKDCQGLFLRHTQSRKCITSSDDLVYDNPSYAFPYFVVMTDNCLDNKAQFRYLNSELLHNIEKDGTLISPDQPTNYRGRWAVYKGISIDAKNSQKSADNRLKQTDTESLSLYNINVCAEPSTTYVMRRTYCDRANQKFTFGSVTQYGARTKDVHCSPTQHMVVKSADYGDFDNGGTFDKNANIDTQCSALTNCQVKSLCSGKRSCELTMNNNLLPSQYCSEASKEIYTKYTCVDTYDSSTITTAPNIRLSPSTYEGYIEIKDDSTWRYLEDKNWDKIRQKMLCQHLGFKETDANTIESPTSFARGYSIATGDLICYKKQPSGTSCCVHLKPSRNQRTVKIPHTRCKICDGNNPILQSSNPTISGGGSERYYGARFYNYETGWCASGSTPYLTLDLGKEYHITRVVTMGNEDQTKWGESYSLKYSYDKTLVDGSRAKRITGNRKGYQASTTPINIYNARYIKINSLGSREFCLRIEFCGEAQTPAPVYDIRITPYQYAARVTWRIRTAPQDSSYITNLVVYLNGGKYETISRGTEINIEGLKPYTTYNVEIETQDGSLQKSDKASQMFTTKEAAPLKLPKKTDDGYTVILKKPKDEQNIKTVALVMLQLQSKSSEPARLENLQQPLPDSPPCDTKADNVAFIAKEFAIDDFQSDKIEISLGEFKEDRRIKRETFKVNKLSPNATYRMAQRNTDGANKHFWSYWSEPFTFTFTKVECENSEQSNCAEKIHMALLIPLVVSVLCFLLSLGVIVYQRRFIQINIKQPCHKCEASEKGERKEEFDSPSGNEATEGLETAPRSSHGNDNVAYESPEYVIGISTEDESAIYTSLKEEKEPDNFYQSLIKV